MCQLMQVKMLKHAKLLSSEVKYDFYLFSLQCLKNTSKTKF